MKDLIPYDFKSELVEKIESRMPEIRRASKAFGKQNSQTTSSLMTLNMLDAGPYRVMRQCLAQIEKKRAALKEAAYKHQKNKIRLEWLNSNLEAYSVCSSQQYKKQNLEREKLLSDLDDSRIYIDACIKEIGAFQQRYFDIMEAHNIPENWTEKDFEDAEIEHHIKSIFRNAIRDRMTGRANHGTMEYMEQFGIEPIFAYRLVDKFIAEISSMMNDDKAPSIIARYNFYENMVKTFRDEYKKALKNIGLTSVTYDEWMLRNTQNG